MTTEQFKILKPEFKNVEGDELWNAMEDYMLRQQTADNILLQTKPFWKRYKIRYLFYYKRKNIRRISGAKSAVRCKNCKIGTGTLMAFGAIGKEPIKTICCNCQQEYIEEPNTNLSHKIYKIKSHLLAFCWLILDWSHIARNNGHGRYEMFGDEMEFVESWSINFNTGKETYKLKSRKWWQYIFIENKK